MEQITKSPSGEKPQVIFQRVKEHIPEWGRVLTSVDQLDIRRLSGLSNACYKVALRDTVHLQDSEMARVVLYRKFECEVVDKQVEAALFRSMSDAGLGPKLIQHQETFRIEEFFAGRPISIWEMRNPVIMRKFVHAIHDFHTRSGASAAIDAIKPLAQSKMGVEIAIDEWGPQCIERMQAIRQKLSVEDQGHRRIMRVLDRLSETYFGSEYQSNLRSIIPDGPVILSHNDCQENNILLKVTDPQMKVCLIDYEYGMWNPEMYDLANYLNEFCCDNAYQAGSGLAFFMDNYPTNDEIVSITRQYYLLKHGEGAVWSMEDHNCQKQLLSVQKCMILNNYYWAAWSIMMLSTADESDPNAFHWDLIEGKCEMNRKCVEEFGFGQI